MEMTRASATPAQGSASVPGSERATPTYSMTGMGPRAKHFGSNSNLRAADFGAKIKQLEELGCRLRGEVDGILKEKDDRWLGDGGMSPPEPRIPLMECQPFHDENDVRSLRDLTDITNEQRTIEAMKSRLNEHSLHAECLQNRARVSSPVRSSLVAPVFPPDARRVDLMLPPSILERELRECRQQNEFLKSQLDSAHTQHSADVQEAHQTIEELKARLFELQGRGEATERAREEERQRHASLVTGLQESVHQLQTANREQEQTLLQTNQKVDAAQQNFYILESALSQLRAILLAAEQRRGRPFLDSDPVQTQSATMLVHCVERCVQEHSVESEARLAKLRQVETALDENRKMSESRLAELTRDRDFRLKELREAETEARRRTDKMEAEIRQLSDANHSQGQDHAARVAEMKDELERQARGWSDKRSALENALDASQRETAAAISRKDQVVKEATELESSLQKATVQRAELKAALEDEQDRRRHLVEQCSRLERQVGVLSEELEAQKIASAKMQDSMERSRRENAKEVTRIKQAEKEAGEREKVELQEKIYAMSEEMEMAKKELSEARLAVDQLQASLTDATERYNMTKIQIDGLSDEKGHLQSIIGNRSAEVERLTAERDYFFRCLDEKTEEVSYLKAEKQRLIAQSSEMLERLEKNFYRLEDRLTDLKVMDEERTKQSGNYYQERESVQVRFAEKERELEAMRSARDSLMRRLKAKEKHVKEMERDRDRPSAITAEHDSGELKERRMELEAVCRERNQLYLELKESRQEALNLANETEEARRLAHERELDLERKLQEVTARLEESDVRPPRVPTARKPTGRVQKEVTTNKNQMTALQSKLKEVEEKTLALEEERRKLKEENTRLVRLLERLTSQNETLSGELEFYLGKNQELLGKVGRAEATIDEAAQRNHYQQREIDALETENAGLRFKLATAATVRVEPDQRVAEHEVQQLGENLRHTLGDVRCLLAEHSEPKSAGDSPVGKLLMERDL